MSEAIAPRRGSVPAIGDPAFLCLAHVPPEAEWFANIANPGKRRVYRGAIRDFTAFVGLADRAILSMLLHHGLRRAELCHLDVGDVHDRRGVRHLKVLGKGRKTQFLPVHPHTLARGPISPAHRRIRPPPRSQARPESWASLRADAGPTPVAPR